MFRWDLFILTPLVFAAVNFVVFKWAKPGKAGKIGLFIIDLAVIGFIIYWLATGV